MMDSAAGPDVSYKVLDALDPIVNYNGSLSVNLSRHPSVVTLPPFAISTSLAGVDGIARCLGRWNEPHHVLFHFAHAVLLVAFLAPNTSGGLLFMHAALIAGFVMLCSWSWSVYCAPDVFSWNFSFLLINSVQVLILLYRLRPIRLSKELDNLYRSMFQPLKVSRPLFKKLVSANICSIQNIDRGTFYAKKDVTKTNRLALLLSGEAHVTCNGELLHTARDNQFLDSAEFESTPQLDDTFKVSVVSVTECRCIVWNRQLLDCLLAKEPFLAVIMSHIIGRDVTNKVYQLKKSRQKPWDANYIDIRLLNQPSFDVCENAVVTAAGVLRTDRNVRQSRGAVSTVPSGVSVDNLRLGGVDERTPIVANGLHGLRSAHKFVSFGGTFGLSTSSDPLVDSWYYDPGAARVDRRAPLSVCRTNEEFRL